MNEPSRTGWYGGQSGDLGAPSVKHEKTGAQKNETTIWDILIAAIVVWIIFC